MTTAKKRAPIRKSPRTKKAPTPAKKSVAPAKKPTPTRRLKKPVIESPVSGEEETSTFELKVRKKKASINKVHFFTLSVRVTF